MAASASEADLPQSKKTDQGKEMNLICMMKLANLKTKHENVKYYEGNISIRNHEDPVQWPKVRINSYRQKTEEQYHAMRNQYHSCLMRTICCLASTASAIKFIAFTSFDCTLEDYLDTNPTIFHGVNFGYFSTDFQGLLRDIVNGLDALDKLGMSCQKLGPLDVYLLKYNYKIGRKTFARLANYREKTMGQDNWRDLGNMVETIFRQYNSFVKKHEILHLCEKLKNGSLQGSKVLDHPAFWSLERRRQFLNKLNAKLQHKSSTPNINIETMYEKIFGSTDLWTTKINEDIVKAVLSKGGPERVAGNIQGTVKEFVRIFRNLCIHAIHFRNDLRKVYSNEHEPDWCVRAVYPLIFIELQDVAQYL